MTIPRLISLKHLSSVRLTVFLLILIVIASIVGTLIPQNWANEQYRAKYGDTFSRVLIRLRLTDVYHSYWYTALLAVFCVNLCVCSTRSFVPLMKSLRRSVSTAGRVELRDLAFYEKTRLRAGIEDVGLEIREIFAGSLYRLKYTDAGTGLYYFERGKISRLGPLITHASIVVILMGGIFVGMLSPKPERKKIPVGETVDVPHSDFQVRADDFKIEFYPDSRTPKEYTSTLTIIEDGVPKITDTVEVNQPMKYRGVKFYQSSYGQIMTDTVEIQLSKSDGDVLGKFTMDEGETLEIPDSPLQMRMAALLPDFVIDVSSGRFGSRSQEPKNPAVLLELYEGGELKDRLWGFLKSPGFHGSGKSGYSLKLLSITTKDYTELQISRDSGLSIVWIGCLLMVIGMFLSFYLSYKRMWVRLTTDNGELMMEIAGRSYKDRSGFEKEFGRLKALLGQPDRTD